MVDILGLGWVFPSRSVLFGVYKVRHSNWVSIASLFLLSSLSKSYITFEFNINMPATVYIVIYSLYGHIYTLAQEVQKGLEASGVTTKLYQGKIA